MLSVLVYEKKTNGFTHNYQKDMVCKNIFKTVAISDVKYKVLFNVLEQMKEPRILFFFSILKISVSVLFHGKYLFDRITHFSVLNNLEKIV